MDMVNKVILIGRLGRDPELRRTASGSAVANFSVATDETWVDANGQKQTRTEWHNIVAWRRLGEICAEFLKKGRLVYIEGKIQSREWDDRDGNKRRTTEIIASAMQMLESKSQIQDPSGEEQVADMEVGITDDDVPF
jgi:single-strand DNA-binding protein